MADVVILIPILGIVFGWRIVLLAIWTEYEKDGALIDKGLYQPEQPKPAATPGWGFLVGGSVVAGIGIALVLSALIFRIDTLAGICGLVYTFVGVALLVVYALFRKKEITPQG
jgi:hypothetical protein